MIRYALAASLLVAPLMAATAAPAADTNVQQLALAKSVVETVFPPAQREALVTNMVGAMIKNVQAGVMQQPAFQEAIAKQPAAEPVFEAFVNRQRDLAVADLKQNLPGLLDAMARAYADHFTAAQLGEMKSFFASPTGQAYVSESARIMSDPAVAAWQQKVVGASMARMPAELKKLQDDLEAAGVKDGD